MGINDYKTTLHRMDAETLQNLTDLATWADQSALPWLRNELAGMMPGKRVGPMKAYDAIRQGLQTTIHDQQTMPLRANFYIAQLTMMDAEVKGYWVLPKARINIQ